MHTRPALSAIIKYLRSEPIDGHDGDAVRISIHQSQRRQFQIVPKLANEPACRHVRITLALLSKERIQVAATATDRDAYRYQDARTDEVLDAMVDQLLEGAVFLDDEDTAGVRTQIRYAVHLVWNQDACRPTNKQSQHTYAKLAINENKTKRRHLAPLF